jgi:adenine-specific DNA-methyltransferase
VFETDPALADALSRSLELAKSSLRTAGHEMTYRIHRTDFIAAASPYLQGQLTFDRPDIPDNFDLVIANPPYFKVRKESEHARLMERVVHGQPNAYAFFLTLAARVLRKNGELIAITPRSFCNGLYFRGFRAWFFERMALDRIHLFESRTEAFRESDVLQESVITKSHRLGAPRQTVTITSSFGRDIAESQSPIEIPVDEIVDASSGQYLVKIPVSEDDQRIMQLVEGLPRRFEDTGLRISTGPVVAFRARDLILREENGQSVVPLLMPHNVKAFRTVWPLARKKHPVYIMDCDSSRKCRLLVPAKNYVILKRFTAKEEKRRLTAACLLQHEQQSRRIGLDNKLNYIYHSGRDLTTNETFGVAAFFNSVLIDRYFRIISGNTQVNATDIRNLHFPSLASIELIGSDVRKLRKLDGRLVERIVLSQLGVTNSLRGHLAGQGNG